MMEHNVDAMDVKLLPSSFTNAITRCTNLNFESSDSSCIAILYPLVSFTLNKPIVTCKGVQDSFKKFITSEKLSTPPLDIQRSKLVETMAIDARFRSTCKLKKNLPLQEAHLNPQAQSRKEMKLEDIGIKLSLLTIYFL